MTLKLRFGRAVHGWLPLTITSGTTAYTCTISHVLDDPLLHLVQATIGFLAGTNQHVPLFEELDVSHICLVVDPPPDRVIVYRSPDFRLQVSTPGTVVVSSEAPRTILARSLWRGLRELQSRTVEEQFVLHWHHPFPDDTLDQLTQRLEQTASDQI